MGEHDEERFLANVGVAGRAVIAVAAVAALLAASAVVATASDWGDPGDPTSSYIVVLADTVESPDAVAYAQADALDADVHGVYDKIINAYVADLSAADVAALQADDQVAYIEPNVVYQLYQESQTVPPGIQRVFAQQNTSLDIDGQDDGRVDADVAVIDSGVSDHADLDVETRVDCTSGTCAEGGQDEAGHGTHVAGSIGAIDNGVGVVGVAPGARIHSVRVCDAQGQCQLSSMLAGIEHVVSQSSVIEVANMSLGGPELSAAFDQAITRLVEAGVVMVVAAGNDAVDAAQVTPARHPDVITVSAMADSDGKAGGTGGNTTCPAPPAPSADDTRANFSNFGSTIEITAPGQCVMSTWNDGGYRVASGTSMSSPHVAGAAAILTSGTNSPGSKADVTAIRDQLLNAGNDAWTDNSNDGTKEPLLDVQSFTATLVPPGENPGPGPTPPTTSTTSTTTTTTTTPDDDPGLIPPQPPPGDDPTPPEDATTLAADWVYQNTPLSVDYPESRCIAEVVIDEVGRARIEAADGDLEVVYQSTSLAQDRRISAAIPDCLDAASRAEMREADWLW